MIMNEITKLINFVYLCRSARLGSGICNHLLSCFLLNQFFVLMFESIPVAIRYCGFEAKKYEMFTRINTCESHGAT